MNSNFLQQHRNNYNLQPLNTLSVPSIAEYFIDITNESLLLDALVFSRDNNYPLTILGGGSNVLLPEYINGLVIKISTRGHSILFENNSELIVRFDAGENWHDIVLWSAENNLYGIENLALIPGTIGAAPIQNIGAYGVELQRCLESVEGFYFSSNIRFSLSNEECFFAYRDSVFKNVLRDKVIITHVTLKLSKVPQLAIDYPALKEQLIKDKNTLESLTSLDVANAVISIRQQKLPNPSQIPNVGSFFKNPIIDKKRYQKISHQYPAVVAYPMANNCYKLAAAWLIDQAGWRGKMVDNICMHENQALVLTNPNGCSTKEVLLFVDKVSESIKKKFGVTLEIEPIKCNSHHQSSIVK
jgi:UDP-N-acetylmuramate dehydrogenase